jgi:hypothetical protein
MSHGKFAGKSGVRMVPSVMVLDSEGGAWPSPWWA